MRQQKEYRKVEDELNNYWIPKMESIKFNSTENNEKTNLDFRLGMFKLRMKDIAAERKKLRE